MYRGAVVALHIVAIIAFAGRPVSAKTPVPFDIQVSSSTVTSGDPITVTISSAATDLPDNVLTELVGLTPRPTAGEIIRPVTGHFELRLVRIRPGVYQGSIDAPDPPGEYVIVPYPMATAWGTADVFPDPAFITVNGRPRLAGHPAQLAIAVGLVAAVIGLRPRRAGRRRALRQRTIMPARVALALRKCRSSER